jgi:hypothetical protein
MTASSIGWERTRTIGTPGATRPREALRERPASADERRDHVLEAVKQLY